MKLKHITFTGISPETNLMELKKIQDVFPIVEWGVLVSRNWRENGARYYDPEYIERLRGIELNLSCHACGYVARQVIRGNWEPIQSITHGLVGIFKRCQVNVSSDEPSEETEFVRPLIGLDELIIQQKSAERMEIYNSIVNHNRVSVLIDASGGQGIDTPLIPFGEHGSKVGYAGGMNPDNIGDKLHFLMESEEVGDFWIDMETGVRTDDRFDTGKVFKVLEVCERVMNEFHETIKNK